MNNRIRLLFGVGAVLLGTGCSYAQSVVSADTLATCSRPKILHRVEAGGAPSYIFPTNDFLKGQNLKGQEMKNAWSLHLKYAFQKCGVDSLSRLYDGTYQGIGVAYHDLGNPEELGNPFSFYLFQGSRIARFSSRLSLNYEWNLGLSFGWKPYDEFMNPSNVVIGSRVNAYIDLDFYLNWVLSRHCDLNAGVTLSHFSNGNTKYPNAGLNVIGARLGVVCYLNRTKECMKPVQKVFVPYQKHLCLDAVVYGSWRRRGITPDGEALSITDAYPVFGFNLTALYPLNRKLRVGVSADGVYDSSANQYVMDYIVGWGDVIDPSDYIRKPNAFKQMALGFSGRLEFVMPYFTVGAGVGTNVLHAGGDLKGLYQVLTLKMDVSRKVFLHIGYSLHDFKEPNHLMLGLGYHFR